MLRLQSKDNRCDSVWYLPPVIQDILIGKFVNCKESNGRNAAGTKKNVGIP